MTLDDVMARVWFVHAHETRTSDEARAAILAFAAEQVAAEREACEAIAQDICDQIMYGEPDPECVGPDGGLNTTELGQLNAAMVIRDCIRARGNP